MQKAEDDLLNWVDEYCNENLLKRLNDGERSTVTADPSGKAIQQAIDSAMAAHHAELRTWNAKLKSIGASLTEDVVKGWSSINKELQQKHEQRLSQINEAVGSLTELISQIGAVSQHLAQLQQHQAQHFADVASTVDTQSQAIQQQSAETQARVEQNLSRMVDSMQTYFSGLEQGIGSLNDVLMQLGEKQVVIQTQAPPRRSWGWFRRDNGRR
jgi:DNA anti-recombination protein RmuC